MGTLLDVLMLDGLRETGGRGDAIGDRGGMRAGEADSVGRVLDRLIDGGVPMLLLAGWKPAR